MTQLVEKTRPPSQINISENTRVIVFQAQHTLSFCYNLNHEQKKMKSLPFFLLAPRALQLQLVLALPSQRMNIHFKIYVTLNEVSTEVYIWLPFVHQHQAYPAILDHQWDPKRLHESLLQVNTQKDVRICG